jgi:hypothetical protein
MATLTALQRLVDRRTKMYSPFEDYVITSVYGLYDLLHTFYANACNTSGYQLEHSYTYYIWSSTEVFSIYVTYVLETLRLDYLLVTNASEPIDVTLPYAVLLAFPYDEYVSPRAIVHVVPVFFYSVAGTLDIMQQF